MPHTTHPRFATYDVVSVFTGEVISTHDTRRQANAAKDARSDRHTLRVRGGQPLGAKAHSSLWHRFFGGRAVR